MIDELVNVLSQLGKTPEEKEQIARTLRALDEQYNLSAKMEREPGVGEIVKQLLGRVFRAYRGFGSLRGQRILDIACGSNSSKAPPDLAEHTPFGAASEGYTALFEPWFCRMLLELGAHPVGIDMGDLAGERFEHYAVDLGQAGALDFLPDHSFDALQDSRLFGSPEFTAQFPNLEDRKKVAAEIWRQEQRLLKPNGKVIHSDAAVLLRQ